MASFNTIHPSYSFCLTLFLFLLLPLSLHLTLISLSYSHHVSLSYSLHLSVVLSSSSLCLSLSVSNCLFMCHSLPLSLSLFLTPLSSVIVNLSSLSSAQRDESFPESLCEKSMSPATLMLIGECVCDTLSHHLRWRNETDLNGGADDDSEKHGTFSV